MALSNVDHTFVVPAYGRSQYLEGCLASLASQRMRSEIVVSTSTPFDGIDELCQKYGARVVRHSPNRGIAHDWNMALAQATTEWATIAHQDDIYLPDFTRRTLALAERQPRALMVFTGYAELGAEGARRPSVAMWIKRVLVEMAFWGREHVRGSWAKTNLLRFGCPVGCPSVSLRLGAIPEEIRFDERYRVNLDWDFWLRLATEVSGGFMCERAVLMQHRIHEGSETTAAIIDGVRAREDHELFARMWPAPIAHFLARAYRLSYTFNRS